MPRSESDLRDLFAGADAPAPSIDTTRVIARARRRRLPRQIGAGAVGALAIVGFVVIGVPLTQVAGPPASSTMEQGAPEGTASDSALETKRPPADRLNLCTGPVAEFESSTTGLRLDVEFPSVAAVGTGTEPVTGLVRLTNTGADAVAGSTASAPAITVSQDGIVLWHSNGPVDASAVRVELAPGESLEYAAYFIPVSCDMEDDQAEQFRAELPALPPGRYELSAAIDFLPDEAPTDGSTPGLDLVTGDSSAIDLE